MKKTRLDIYTDASALALNTLDTPEGETLDAAILQTAENKAHSGADYLVFKQFVAENRNRFSNLRNTLAPSAIPPRPSPQSTVPSPQSTAAPATAVPAAPVAK